MKRIKLLLVALFVVFGFFGTLYLNDDTAVAARARCYMVAGVGGSEVSCGNITVIAKFVAKGMTPEDNKCYIYAESDLKVSPCDKDPFTGPRCYLSSLGGSGIQSCTSSGFAQAFAANGLTAQSGHCYIFDGLIIQDVDCNYQAFGGTGTTPTPVSATPVSTQPPGGFENPYEEPEEDNAEAAAKKVGEIATIARDDGFEEVDDSCNVGNQGADCSITDKLNSIANVLSLGVGIIIVIMIIVGGIQYTMAGGDAGKVAGAKGRITNAIYALIAYFFLFAFFQWIVPGGVF